MSRMQIKQAWLIVSIIILIFANAGFGIYNYVLRRQYQKREIIIKNIAKKDSIKAKIADTRLINVARPDSVKVLPATGQTILYINNSRISSSPITNFTDLALADSDNVKDSDIEETKMHNDLVRLRASLTRMRAQVDSLYSANLLLKATLTKSLTPAIIAKTDTIAKAPVMPSDNSYIIGMRQKKRSNAVPDWSISLRGAASYSMTRNAISTGIGIQGSYKNTSVFGLMYYDWATRQWRGVAGLQQDFIRITSSKK